MSVLFLQTADAERYQPLLELTSRTVIKYCQRHSFEYESFVGIWRGQHAWQATYNRIPMLQRVAEGGFTGWVCYMDADAFVADLDFDLVGYLSDKSHLALIVASGNPEDPALPFYHTNAGVLLINLGHPLGGAIIRAWAERFDSLSDADLAAASVWDQVTNDQEMLGDVLRSLPGAEAATLVLRGQPNLINYDRGKFIRQQLRAHGNMQQRIDAVRSETDQVLGLSGAGNSPSVAQDARIALLYEELLTAFYRTVLMREPDPPGLAHHTRELIEGRLNITQALSGLFSCNEFLDKRTLFAERYLRTAGRTAASGGVPIQAGGSTLTTLTGLADKYRSDKGTRYGEPPHRYTTLYDLILYPYRNQPINFLEIGLAVGGPEVGGPVDRQVVSPSVLMWLDYFSIATVYGFDISDFSHMRADRFHFIRGDSGSAEDLRRLASAAPHFDIVIDDASHASYHQQLAFKHLFPRVASGGLYIIEDLHWQSPQYESILPRVPKTGDFLTSYFEDFIYTPNNILSRHDMRKVMRETATFSSFPSFNGAGHPVQMIVIRKERLPRMGLLDGPYRSNYNIISQPASQENFKEGINSQIDKHPD